MIKTKEEIKIDNTIGVAFSAFVIGAVYPLATLVGYIALGYLAWMFIKDSYLK